MAFRDLLARNRDNMRGRQRILLGMPFRSQLLFYTVVFCTFAPLGVLPSMLMLGAVPVPYLFLYAGYWGSLGVLIVFTSLRTLRWLPVVVAGSALAAVAAVRWGPAFHAPTSLDAAGVAAARRNLAVIVWLTIGAIVIAYRTVLWLVVREGHRFWSAHAEIRLAQAIHLALVPVVEGRRGTVSWLGRSYPSGEVGGDLVDVIDGRDTHAEWIGCLADVSGHGVGAGLLMGMLKTALHGAADGAPDVGALVTRANAVLSPLSEPNMFVTAAVIGQVDARTFGYVLAGHPPLLWWHAGDRRTEWVGEPQLAMCVVPDTRYEPQTLAAAPGDLVIAVTDGLLEVFDPTDRELGRDGLARALDGIDETTPLSEVEQRLFEVCRRYGRQTDDQTVLIVRVGPEAAGDPAGLRMGRAG